MLYTFKQLLENIAREKAPGPFPTFSVYHLLCALEAIAQKPIGRGQLAAKLEVGEGVIRTILDRLKDAGLIETSKAGCVLTANGRKLWDEWSSIVEKVEIGKSELTFADFSFAILVKKCGHKVKSGVEQRDAAVKVGAKGVTTIIFKNGKLVIPSVSDDVSKDFPKAAKQILTYLDPKENDVILVGSANTLKEAEYGILAAAWTLLD